MKSRGSHVRWHHQTLRLTFVRATRFKPYDPWFRKISGLGMRLDQGSASLRLDGFGHSAGGSSYYRRNGDLPIEGFVEIRRAIGGLRIGVFMAIFRRRIYCLFRRPSLVDAVRAGNFTTSTGH